MFIRKTVIEGFEGEVEIERVGWETVVRAGGKETRLDIEADRPERLRAAREAAKVIFGPTNQDEPNATGSMVHDVLREIERIADR